MRNLLTNQSKRLIQKEYRIRLAVLSSLFLSASLVIGGVFLIPSYLLSESRKISIENQAYLVEQSPALQEDGSLSAALRLAQEELDVLSSTKDKKLFSERLEDIVQEKPAGISLTSFTYIVLDDRKSSMTLSGKARTREDLLSFEKKLKNNPDFNSVEFPVASLAKDKDIGFSITLEYKL